MADGDQRVEVLEDEMKVLKGEVSRTLVDLRAMLMREDSPLMTGASLKRVSDQGDGPSAAPRPVKIIPAADSTPSVVSITGPGPLDPEPPPLAGQPGKSEIEMPQQPGAATEASMPSQEDGMYVSPATPPVVATSSPTAPSSGDFRPPAANLIPEHRLHTGGEEEHDDERASQRKARLQREELEEEERSRKRDQDRADEDAVRENRNRRRQREMEEEQADQERRDRRRKKEREEDEDRERRNLRRHQQEDDNVLGSDRRGHTPSGPEVADDEPEAPWGRYETELNDEHERFRPVRPRGEELEDEMERLSNSHMPQDDRETHSSSEFDANLPHQELEDSGGPMVRLPVGADSRYADVDEYGIDERTGNGAPRDRFPRRDSAYGGKYPPERGKGEGYADSDDDRYDNEPYDDERDDDWGFPPASGPTDNFDSQEYQEGPKINGQNGSGRPRRPDAGRRAYEDNYYEDQYQESGRGPQNTPRPQRAYRSFTDGRRDPRGRRPDSVNYGYAPNGGIDQWGQPPAGYEQWAAAPQQSPPEPSPMDLNLVSSLVRWASLAKFRVGEKRLSEIIELYVESRCATGGLKDALTHIASIVDDQPPESGQSAQETLDLITHLHGILTAALPVPEVPQIRSQIRFVAGNGNGNVNKNGDW